MIEGCEEAVGWRCGWSAGEARTCRGLLFADHGLLVCRERMAWPDQRLTRRDVGDELARTERSIVNRHGRREEEEQRP